MRQSEKLANAANNSNRIASAKSIFQRISAFMCFSMLISTAGIVESNSEMAIFAYMAVTVSLLYFGKTFRFQTRNNR